MGYKGNPLKDKKPGFTEKMDVLDLLINTIKEHEEKLDELVSRIEKTVGTDYR